MLLVLVRIPKSIVHVCAILDLGNSIFPKMRPDLEMEELNYSGQHSVRMKPPPIPP